MYIDIKPAVGCEKLAIVYKESAHKINTKHENNIVHQIMKIDHNMAYILAANS